MSLKEDVQHRSMFVDGPPKPMRHPTDNHMHFIEMPPGTLTGFPVA